MLTVLIKNIKPTECMLSTQTKGWVGTGALKYTSAMADSKKATKKQHWTLDSKNNPSGPGPRGARENISTYFVPQPVENTTKKEGPIKTCCPSVKTSWLPDKKMFTKPLISDKMVVHHCRCMNCEQKNHQVLLFCWTVSTFFSQPRNLWKTMPFYILKMKIINCHDR